jgi:hypothetical protein
MNNEEVGAEIEKNCKDARIGVVVGKCLGMEVTPKYKNHVVIEVEAALYHIERCREHHPDLVKYLRLVFLEPSKRGRVMGGGVPSELTPESIADKGSGFQCCAGFLDLYLRFNDLNIPTVLRHPETCLHPTAAARLGGVLATIATGK